MVEELLGAVFYTAFLNLTDKGENVQKWTRVFSTRC